jgi:hypothetical protein
MRCDEAIAGGQQRIVAVRRLLTENVECRRINFSGIESVGKGLFVYQSAARSVNHYCPGLHQRQ